VTSVFFKFTSNYSLGTYSCSKVIHIYSLNASMHYLYFFLQYAETSQKATTWFWKILLNRDQQQLEEMLVCYYLNLWSLWNCWN